MGMREKIVDFLNTITLAMLMVFSVVTILGVGLLMVIFLGPIITLELIVFTCAMIPLLILIAWKKGAFHDLFFTIETGNIAFVDAGQTRKFTYANVMGKVLKPKALVQGKERVNVLVDGDCEAAKTWLQREYGLYWKGPRFLNRKVHIFPLVKTRIKSGITAKTDPKEWIEEDEPVDEYQLRGTFPRPVQVVVEFKDRIGDIVLLLVDLEILLPDVAIYTLKARYVPIIEDYVRNGVNKFCQGMSAKDFISVDKLNGGDLSKQVTAMINPHTEDRAGITVKGMAVTLYRQTTTKEEDAMEAESLATLQGLAAIATAKADAEAKIVGAKAEARVKVIDAKALAKADRILGQASVADVMATFDGFTTKGTSPDVAAHESTALGRSKRFAEHDSPVTTLVDGQSPTALPLSERKVKVVAR